MKDLRIKRAEVNDNHEPVLAIPLFAQHGINLILED
jgi:hypothetical protein